MPKSSARRRARRSIDGRTTFMRGLLCCKLRAQIERTESREQKMKSIVRSILAILAGLIVLTVVSFALEAAVNRLLPYLFPSSFQDQNALSRSIPARLIMTVYTLL